MYRNALLALDDGQLLYGRAESIGPTVCTEMVFTTAMTGYQQAISDPSYQNQILMFTFPHIGATGITESQLQSCGLGISGLVVYDLCSSFVSHPYQDLKKFLQSRSIPCISGIDTRKIALSRTKNKYACLMTDIIDEKLALSLAQSRTKTATGSLNYSRPFYYHVADQKNFLVAVIDYGVKQGIIDMLTKRGCNVVIIPSGDVQLLDKYDPDGFVISNGPGDPSVLDIAVIKKIVSRGVPILGICLGHQLLGLAYGADIYRMDRGQHGINHAVLDLERNKFFITSQNHDYVVQEATLPSSCYVTHRSLVDGSVAGFRAKNDPVITFQGHPEAMPGPYDMEYLFDEFIGLMRR